jgi:hypothetical protein
MTSRRTFLFKVIPAAGALAVLGGKALAAPATVSETDPQAVALGYKAVGSKVDKAKFPKYAATQHCGNCQLFQGKATDAAAPCAIFGGKLVANKGWCSAWVKKA